MIKLRLLPGIFTCLTALLSAQTVYTVKMATVAPEGSLWMREFHKFDKDLSKPPEGRSNSASIRTQCRAAKRTSSARCS